MPEKLRDRLVSELERAMALLPDTDPRSEEYGRLLFALGEINYRLMTHDCVNEYPVTVAPPAEVPTEPPADALNDAAAPVPVEEEPIVDTDDLKGDTEYIDPESFRAELRAVKNKGVVISELISSLGASNYTALMGDQNKLRQLKAMVEKALEEL